MEGCEHCEGSSEPVYYFSAAIVNETFYSDNLRHERGKKNWPLTIVQIIYQLHCVKVGMQWERIWPFQ